MKLTWFLPVAIIMSLMMISSAQNTIKDLINNRTGLSTIQHLLQGTETFDKLGRITSPLTFFAAHNSAFQNMSAQLIYQLNHMTTMTADSIFQYHTVSGLTSTSNLTSPHTALRLYTLASSGQVVLFMCREDTAYINGARFLEADISASNGILHVIDSFFVDLGTVGPTIEGYTGSAGGYISQQTQTSDLTQRTTKFQSLLSKYDDYVSKYIIMTGPFGSLTDQVLNSNSRFITTFVPSDQAMQTFQAQNPDVYNELYVGTGPPGAFLQMVVESHTIPTGVYHADLLMTLTSGSTIPAMKGNIRMYMYNGAFYVSNNCVQAMVTKGNITANNGVIYMIDNLFGTITYDLFNQIRYDYSLSEFWGTIEAAPGSFQQLLEVPPGVTNVSNADKLTVFAPNGDAYSANDYSQDPATQSLQLNMTILYGTLLLNQMRNGTQVAVLAAGFFAKFYQIVGLTYVEVNYVRGQIVQANICTKNGIIHKVDTILGVPSTTVYGEISTDSQLSQLQPIVNKVGLMATLQDPTNLVTMFTPNNAAIQAMQSQSPSYFLNLNQQLLTNIMNRHVAQGEVFLDQFVAFNSSAVIDTYNGEITVINRNNEYYVVIGSRKIHVIRANMRMTNGVVHIIDQVLYDPNDPTTAQSVYSSSVSLLSSGLFSFISFFFFFSFHR